MLTDHAFNGYRFESIEPGRNYTLYRFTGLDGVGEGRLDCYQVMPGVSMTYDHMENMKSCYQEVEPVAGYFQVNYCIEGCYEFEMADGQVCFMGEGDLCVSNPWSRHFVASRLPLAHYRGLALFIDIDKAQESIDAYFPKASLRIRPLADALFAGHASFMVRARPELEHIFAELRHVDERIREVYCPLKLLEALLFLRIAVDDPHSHLPQFTKNVVARTKEVHGYLIANKGSRVTVRSLAERFHISESVLQQCFKSIYGQPVATFIRTHRIQQGAALLREDDALSIGEAAHMVGYENQSKFAAAFKAVMGLTPLAYRHRVEMQKSGEME